jgi:hypothetical protein
MIRNIQNREGGVGQGDERGTTLHGMQSFDPARRGEPLTYFHRTGPIGQIFASRYGLDAPIGHVGVAGLGVGGIGQLRAPRPILDLRAANTTHHDLNPRGQNSTRWFSRRRCAGEDRHIARKGPLTHADE